MQTYNPWSTTKHAQAFDSVTIIQNNPSCLPCHTTGWDTTIANGGYDDYYFTGNTAGMTEMRNVQCESCHGPTQFPTYHPPAKNYDANVCGGCHTGDHHPTMDEWNSSVHSWTAPAVAQIAECAKCHEAKTALLFLSGEANPAMPDPINPQWNLPCATCHAPHSDSSFSPGNLRADMEEICMLCHTDQGATIGQIPYSPQREMYLGEGGYEFPGYNYPNSPHYLIMMDNCMTCHMFQREYVNPDTIAITGHSFYPDVRACQFCHPGAINFNIDNAQTDIQEQLLDLDELLTSFQQSGDTLSVEYQGALFNYNFVHNDLSSGVHNYNYAEALLQASINILQNGVEQIHTGEIPREYSLKQNYPNPFNPTTSIEFAIPENGYAKVEIFDLQGKALTEMFAGNLNAGEYKIVFNGDGFPSGIYFYRFTTSNTVMTKKMTLLK
jgi:predicted CXXCH cytochrome family protein